MSKIAELIGEEVVGKEGKVKVASFCGKDKVVGKLMFSLIIFNETVNAYSLYIT